LFERFLSAAGDIAFAFGMRDRISLISRDDHKDLMQQFIVRFLTKHNI
jgi:hypothetical protein